MRHEESVSYEEYRHLCKKLESREKLLASYKELTFSLEDLLRNKDKERDASIEVTRYEERQKRLELKDELNSALQENEKLRLELKTAMNRIKMLTKQKEDKPKSGNILDDVQGATPTKEVKRLDLHGAALASHMRKTKKIADEMAARAKRRCKRQPVTGHSDPDVHPD